MLGLQMDKLIEILLTAVKITALVLIMMIIVDIINVRTKGKLHQILRDANALKQYVVASLLGAAPGCVGSFAGVSMYMHGFLSFGALTGLMFATAGDEQFIMLAMFPKTALIMFGILFVIGIAVGYITDVIVKKYKIKVCSDCSTTLYHEQEHGAKHYWKEHVLNHIIKKHLLKTFLWTAGAMLVLELGLHFVNLEAFTRDNVLLMLLLAAVIGFIPESGPHLIFVMMFANGLIPFSVLFTSSIVQDGHGMLPLLAHSVRDSVTIKAFNLVFGLSLGLIIYLLGF